MENRKFGNITLIEGNNEGKYPFCHTLLVEGSQRVLVDPACGRKKMQAVREQGKIDIIINTHYHEDHLAYNYLFPEADIYVHREDQLGFSSLEGYWKMAVDMTPDQQEEWNKMLRERFHFLGWTPSRLLEDGDELQFAETRARVIHTPGHTPGHFSLHFPDQELLYLGDIDLSWFGPWYGDISSSISDTIHSVRKVQGIKAKWYVVSHEGPVFEDIQELAESYLQVVELREQRVLENIQQPATLEELRERWIIYRKAREPANYFAPSEKAMGKKHLELLISKGKATMNGDKYIATKH